MSRGRIWRDPPVSVQPPGARDHRAVSMPSGLKRTSSAYSGMPIPVALAIRPPRTMVLAEQYEKWLPGAVAGGRFSVAATGSGWLPSQLFR